MKPVQSLHRLLQRGRDGPPAGAAGETVPRAQRYLAGHAPRMRYRELAASGPIGSGAVESACPITGCAAPSTLPGGKAAG